MWFDPLSSRIVSFPLQIIFRLLRAFFESDNSSTKKNRISDEMFLKLLINSASVSKTVGLKSSESEA